MILVFSYQKVIKGVDHVDQTIESCCCIPNHVITDAMKQNSLANLITTYEMRVKKGERICTAFNFILCDKS